MVNFADSLFGVFEEWFGDIVDYELLELDNKHFLDDLVFLSSLQVLVLHLVVHFPGVPRLRDVTLLTLIVTQLPIYV